MSEKWTKGPWIAHDHGVGELVVYEHETESVVCILDDTDGSYAWPDDYSVSEEARANAHLIAAAPTLAYFALSKAEQGCEEAISMLSSLNIFDEEQIVCLRQKYGMTD